MDWTLSAAIDVIVSNHKVVTAINTINWIAKRIVILINYPKRYMIHEYSKVLNVEKQRLRVIGDISG
jgi:hypothetical protein